MKKNYLKENKRRGKSEVSSSLIKLPPVNAKQPVRSNYTLNTISSKDQGLVSILYEYFIKNSYLDTLDCFQKDYCKQTKTSNKYQEQMKKQLLSLFDKGERISFFIKFAHFVPTSMRMKDLRTMKIQFYLQLYFFIYSVHPCLGKKKTLDQQSKKMFIEYLQKGYLSKSQDFLHYYSLANILRPQNHPLYTNLFTPQWPALLKKSIAYFLQKLFPSDNNPTLNTMYDIYIDYLEKQSQTFPTEHEQELSILEQIIEKDNEMNLESALIQKQKQVQSRLTAQQIQSAEFKQITSLKATIEQLQQQKESLSLHLQSQKIKYKELQKIYTDFSEKTQNIIVQSQTKWLQLTQNIYALTDQVLSACKYLREGLPLSDPDSINKISLKLQKYERFMKIKIEEMMQGQNLDFSVFASDGENDSTIRNRVGKPGRLIQLDFNKIKLRLNQAQIPKGGKANSSLWQSKILLLQALKWRINQSKSAIAKRQAVLSYIIYDLLGLHNNEDNTIFTLLNSQSYDVAQETIALINAFTYDYYGREYVICQKVFKPMIELFVGSKISPQWQLQLIISFQICSNIKLAQEILIRYEMINIIISTIQNQLETIQPQYLHYLVALLTNILTHKEGTQKAKQIKERIMKTLINLIQYQSMRIGLYIYASLYSLLCLQTFREVANKYGLLQNINFLLQNKEGKNEEQLICLKEKLQQNEDRVNQEIKEGNIDFDEFLSEEYLREFDYSEIFINGIKGEELLIKQYALLGPQSLLQRNAIREKVRSTLKVIIDGSLYDRQSVAPSISNKLKRNTSNNNSFYSNKSSNRILMSSKTSRSQMGAKNHTTNFLKMSQQKLETENHNEIKRKQDNRVHENTEEYKNVFETRAKLLRTPRK